MKTLLTITSFLILSACLFFFLYETPYEKAEEIAKQVQENKLPDVPKEDERSFEKFIDSFHKTVHSNSTYSIRDEKNGYITMEFTLFDMSTDNSDVKKSYYGSVSLKFKRNSLSELRIIDVKISPIKPE